MTSKLALKASSRCINFRLKLNTKFITKVYSTLKRKCTGCMSESELFKIRCIVERSANETDDPNIDNILDT